MTKEELNKIISLDSRINSKIRQLDELRQTIGNIQSIDYSKDKVQTSPSNQIENTIIKIMDHEEKIAKDIDNLIEMKEQARKAINKVEGIYGVVLEMRYLECMQFEEIAYRLNYSLVHIHRLHGQALNMIANVIEC